MGDERTEDAERETVSEVGEGHDGDLLRVGIHVKDQVHPEDGPDDEQDRGPDDPPDDPARQPGDGGPRSKDEKRTT